MNNKGFNWFFPIVIIALLLFLVQFPWRIYSKTIDEDGFFREMQENQNIIIYKDIEKADVFLTKEGNQNLNQKGK
jgi:cell division protease FtsH